MHESAIYDMRSLVKTTSSFWFQSFSVHTTKVGFIWKKFVFDDCFPTILLFPLYVLIHRNFFVGVKDFKIVLKDYLFGWFVGWVFSLLIYLWLNSCVLNENLSTLCETRSTFKPLHYVKMPNILACSNLCWSDNKASTSR